MGKNVTWLLPGVPKSVPLARKLVRELLAGHPQAAETAALTVSELVTNAIVHSASGDGGLVAVAVQPDGPAGVRVGVRDDNGEGVGPHPGCADLWDERGRGLALVTALTDGWSTVRAGKYRWIWCRICWDGDGEHPRQ